MGQVAVFGVAKVAALAALLAIPAAGAAVSAHAEPGPPDPGYCTTHSMDAGCPITSPADPRCNANPAAAGCMGGAPIGPADPRCIAMPTGVCAGGPYDHTPR
jgi:hypothetical protein